MKKIVAFACFLCGWLITPASAQNNASKDINQVISQYLAVKDALAAGDGNLALSHAKDLLAAVKSVSPLALTDAQRKTWLSYEPKLEFDSRHISEVNHVDHQREHFVTLSDNLYAVLKGLKLNKATLYHQYCTMNKHYYLSQAEKGKDPYMGMDNCSKVADILPAVK
jgi:hypothetical protein